VSATDFYNCWCGWIGHGQVCPTHHYCRRKEDEGDCSSSHTTDNK